MRWVVFSFFVWIFSVGAATADIIVGAKMTGEDSVVVLDRILGEGRTIDYASSNLFNFTVYDDDGNFIESTVLSKPVSSSLRAVHSYYPFIKYAKGMKKGGLRNIRYTCTQEDTYCKSRGIKHETRISVDLELLGTHKRSYG